MARLNVEFQLPRGFDDDDIEMFANQVEVFGENHGCCVVVRKLTHVTIQDISGEEEEDG